MAKRYVLFLAEEDFTETALKEIDGAFRARGWKAKLIPVQGSPKALIVKTTAEHAAAMRGSLRFAGAREIRSVLASGAVGNLKRRARGPDANGQVHE